MNIRLSGFSGWRRRRFHVSVVLAWLSVGLIAGIFMGQSIVLSARFWPLLLVGFVVLVAMLRRGTWYVSALAVVLGICLGAMRGSVFLQELHALDTFAGRQVTLQATLSQDPVLTNGSDTWQVQMNAIEIGGSKYVGEVYASVLSDETLKRGDKLTISGKALAGFGNFRLSMFRAQVLHATRPDDPFLAARDKFAQAARTVMPEPEASLGLGFLVGEKSSLSNDLSEQLKTVGLTHIIVASGYNLTIFVRFARRLFAKRSRYLAFVGSLVLVAGYVLISGFSPSMNRAAVVTFLTLLAWYYGRKFHPVQLILLVASVSAFMYPVYLWSDLGWLLSFAAFTGVLVVAPVVTRLIYKPGVEPGALIRLVIETLSAEIMTLPLIVASFGYVPTLALLANVVVAPVIPFAMFFTFVAGVAGVVGTAVGLAAFPASILVAYVVAVVENLSSPDWARFAVQLPLWFFVLWYVALGVFVTFVWKRRRVDLLETSVVE